MNAEQPGAEPAKKPTVTVSRVLLILILIAAIAALGFDYLAKRRMNAAYQTLDRLNDSAEKAFGTSTAPLQGVSQSTVRQELGRDPDETDKQEGGVLIEYYNFPGVFYNHRLTVEYQTFQDETESMRRFQTKSVFHFGGE